jgi:hypothetical protein
MRGSQESPPERTGRWIIGPDTQLVFGIDVDGLAPGADLKSWRY